MPAAARRYLSSLLLPTALVHEDVRWSPGPDDEHAIAQVQVPGDDGHLCLRVDGDGRLRELSMQRWGNPEGGDFHELSFSGSLADERRFGPLTIPTTIRAGWYFGSDRYADEGEFFRASIDEMEFR